MKSPAFSHVIGLCGFGKLPLIVSVAAGGIFLSSNDARSTESDWNQWRGPDRNGVSRDDTPLADAWPEEGPPLLWESEKIPSDHYGGHGSCVAADGKVYMALIWHRDVPTETRAIDRIVLSKLGYRGNNFSPELRARAEEARLSRNPRLRGDAFEEWARKWVEENLDEDQQMTVGSWMIQRLRGGSEALSFDDFDKLVKMDKHRFENHEALVGWLDGQGFTDQVKAQILSKVPNTRMAAEEVILCLDAETGKTVWKQAWPADETSRNASSTPTVVDGRVYAVLRENLYCVDANNGDLLWKSPLPAIGPASCPLVVDGKVVVLADRLVAYGIESGEKVWEQQALTGRTGSPVACEAGGKTLILCNGKNGFVAVDARTGEVVWKGEGGGDSTPVASGNYVVTFSSSNADGGLKGYRVNDSGDGLEEIWKHTWKSRRKHATPIIYEGYVYLLGGGKHLCVDLESGEIQWDEERNSEISSPVLVDDKIFVLESGSYITMLKATSEGHAELGRARLRPMRCPTPTIAGGRLLLRMEDRIACFDLRTGDSS